MRGRWLFCLFASLCAFSSRGQSIRHRVVAPPVQRPSTGALIDSAVAAGKITDEQGLEYKVFNDFGDSRLPAQYKGDDTGLDEGDSAEVVASQWATLSAAAREIIGPFTVPPFYSGSWWDRRRAGIADVPPPPCRPWEALDGCAVLSRWSYVEGDNIRVWYLDDYKDEDGPTAIQMAQEATNKIWPELSRVMQRVPIADHTYKGTTRLDVVLTDGMSSDVSATTYGYHNKCGPDSTYILINRESTDLNNGGRRLSLLAHELFHSVQFTYKVCFESFSGPSYRWLMESTATWFEDELYPLVDREHRVAPDYLQYPELSIDDKSAPNARRRNYGAYLFFFYLTRVRTPLVQVAFMRDLWTACQDSDPLHALDSALSAYGAPLDKSWPDFALYNWNEEAPYNTYTTVDDMRFLVKMSDTQSVSLTDDPIKLGDRGTGLPHLSMRYYQFDFPNSKSVAAFVFFNGLQRALTEKNAKDIGPVLSAPAVSDPTTVKGAHVDALLEVGGKWQKADGFDAWDGKPYRTYCRDVAKERVQSMIVILSNSSIDTGRTIKPQGTLPPLILVDNIGCKAWEGTADLKYVDGSGKMETMSVLNLRLDVLGDVGEDDSTPSKRMFTVTKGDFAWIASGSRGGCGWSGSMNGPMAGPVNVIYTFPWVKRTSTVARGILAALPQQWIAPQMILQQNCGSTSEKLMWNAGQFFLVTDPTEKYAPLQPDGRTILVDPSKIQGKEVNGNWTLTAVAEP